MMEVCLRSCCCRSVFDSCMVHLVIFIVCGDGSSWYVEMVFFMVCGDGCILRTHGVLAKGVVYSFIWHVILGVRMVSFFMSWYTLDTHLEF